MSLLTPAALAFAAALPVVVIFYLLKRKRVVKLVSSTLLWQKFLADTQASAPFQRLRHNWLLILQLLMLALAVFALMRPFLMGQARDFSLPMLVMFVTGVALWLVYGVFLGSASVVLANAVTLVLAGYILVIKVRHG